MEGGRGRERIGDGGRGRKMLCLFVRAGRKGRRKRKGKLLARESIRMPEERGEGHLLFRSLACLGFGEGGGRGDSPLLAFAYPRLQYSRAPINKERQAAARKKGRRREMLHCRYIQDDTTRTRSPVQKLFLGGGEGDSLRLKSP